MAGQAADAALDLFTKALTALQEQDWANAAVGFRAVLETGDAPELRDRARQYLVVCRSRGGEAKGQAPAQEEVDPYLAAVVEKNRGNLALALEMCAQGERDRKDDRFAYLAASIHAVEGRAAESAEALERAIALNPTNRVHAFHDPDFAALRHERELQPLFDLA